MREGYKMTELGEIPINWEVKRFDDIAVISMGQSPSGDTYNQNEIGIPLINGPTEFTYRYPIKKQWTTSPTKLCEPGDVLLCVRGSSTGRINISNDTYCIGRGIAALRSRTNYDNSLLEYITKNAVEKILSLTSGSTFPNIDSKSLRSIQVAISSSLLEQQKIASILSTVDEKIEVIDAQITQTRELKKGLMQKLLTRGIGHTKFKDSVLGEIPESWEVGIVSEFAKVNTGAKDTQNRVIDGEYPFYVRSQTIERINSFSFDGEAILTAGDGVGVGKVFHYVNGKFDYHQRVYNIFGFSDKLNGKYFFEYFRKNFIHQVEKYNAKGSVDSVRMDMIAKMNIPIPPMKEQYEIASILTTINDKQEILKTKKGTYQQLKKGLMQQLLTGKVRVIQSELEKEIAYEI